MTTNVSSVVFKTAYLGTYTPVDAATAVNLVDKIMQDARKAWQPRSTFDWD